MRFGDYECYPLDMGDLMVDGGALFGTIPKTQWQTRMPADTDNMIRIKSPACSTFRATQRTAPSAVMPLPSPGPMPPKPVQMPAPNSAIEALRAVDSGNDLNINIKLTNKPKIAGVWDTA